MKSVPIGIRTDPELRSKLEEAAAAKGVSLTQEIEQRLRSSFEWEKAGPDALELFRDIMRLLSAVKKLTGQEWSANRFSFGLAYRAMQTLLERLRPPEVEEREHSWEMAEIEAIDLTSNQLSTRLRLIQDRHPDLKSLNETEKAELDTIFEELAVLRARRKELEQAYRAYRERESEMRGVYQSLGHRIALDAKLGTNYASEVAVPDWIRRTYHLRGSD